jgi:hypothetical protein
MIGSMRFVAEGAAERGTIADAESVDGRLSPGDGLTRPAGDAMRVLAVFSG